MVIRQEMMLYKSVRSEFVSFQWPIWQNKRIFDDGILTDAY